MLRITGYSDDILSIESDFGSSKEYPVDGKIAIVTVTNLAGGVEISAWYQGPCWAYTFMQLPDSETEVPWPIVLDQDSTYSLAVEIQCSDNVKWKVEMETA